MPRVPPLARVLRSVALRLVALRSVPLRPRLVLAWRAVVHRQTAA